MQRTKVLVVDQEQEQYQAIQPGLSKHGYEIHTTRTVPQALALAGAHQYKVAFVAFPLVQETSLLAALRAELPDLALILVLSRAQSDHIPPQILTMVTNTLGKPLTLEAVCLMLDHTLEVATLRTQIRQHRQAWPDLLTRQCPAPSQAGDTPRTMASFDALLTSGLRHMFPNLELFGRGALHNLVLSHVEKLLISVVLNECRGNQVQSAKILGINRNTLRKKIHDLNIDIPRGGV